MSTPQHPLISSTDFIKKARLLPNKYPGLPYLLKWLLLCSIIGSAVGSASAFFLYTLDLATRIRETHSWIIFLLPVAGLAIGLLYKYRGKKVEAGNNLIIDAIHQPTKKIPFLMAPMVYTGTIITHLFGGSAGREGTALQMAAGISSQLANWLRIKEEDYPTVLIAAVSAGFGSVFGTPLAGAVFALEFYAIGRIRYQAIVPAFLCAIIADITTLAFNTGHTHYSIPTVPSLTAPNLLYAIIAGIVFGMVAAAFSKLMHSTGKLFKQQISYAPLRPVIGGCIVVAAIWLVGSTRYIGLGVPVIVEAFKTPLPWWDFSLKIAFTVITLSCGFKGGEVTPLFFIGAALGSCLSLVLPLPTALLAGMGFVAVFAGATNTPLACMLMAIELFGADCGVFAAIACVVSYLLSGHNSIYGGQLIATPKNNLFAAEAEKRINEL